MNYEKLPLKVNIQSHNIPSFLTEELGDKHFILDMEESKKYNITLCYIGNNDVLGTTHPNRVSTSLDDPKSVRNFMNCKKIIVLQLKNNTYYPLSDEIASKLIKIYGEKSLTFAKTLFI